MRAKRPLKKPSNGSSNGLSADSEDLFRQLFDTNPVSMWVWDHKTYRFLAVNYAAIALYGYSRERFLGMTLLELKPPEDQGGMRDIVQRNDAGSEGLTSRHMKANGDIVDAAIYSRTILYKGQSASLVTVINTTDRTRSDHILRLVYSVAHHLADPGGNGSALKRVMREICESEFWDLCRYYRLDETSQVMRFEDFWCREGAKAEKYFAAARGHSVRCGEGLVGAVWKSDTPIWCTDAETDDRFEKDHKSREMFMRAALVFPLRSAGKTLGALALTSAKIRAPDERLLLAVQVMGGQIGQNLYRKQREAVLRQSETRFRKLTALSSDWYWELDSNLRFIEVSETVSPRWGVRGTEMLGRTRWELPGSIPTTKDRSLIDAAVEARLPYRNLGYDVVSPDGSRHYVQSSAEPIFNEAGQFSGYRGVGRDITELKRSERLKDEFVATVSHELRTPLTSIAGSLSLLMGGKAGELPESASRLLAIAHANSQRLVRLVNDILDIEKLESGQVVFKLIWLDVVPIVEQAIEEIRGFADVYGAHITLIATPTTRKVHVDPDRLAQVLTNLFSNAIKFSAKGEEVTVTVELRGEAVRISVRDRGPGIPIDFRPNIFRKFAQANATNTRERGGTGLGLTIVQQIVNRLDGEVGFEDAPGGGSIFHVEFPSWDVIPTGAPDANGISESGRLTERQDRSLQ